MSADNNRFLSQVGITYYWDYSFQVILFVFLSITIMFSLFFSLITAAFRQVRFSNLPCFFTSMCTCFIIGSRYTIIYNFTSVLTTFFQSKHKVFIYWKFSIILFHKTIYLMFHKEYIQALVNSSLLKLHYYFYYH